MSNKLEEIRAKAAQVKKATENEKTREIQRTIDAIAVKAVSCVSGWLAGKPEMLKHDIRKFFFEETEDGKSPASYITDGCGLYFGRSGSDALVTKDFGSYIMALEKSNPGSHFPYVLKINVRAPYKLNKLISKRLGVDNISHDVVDELLKFEKERKLLINFVSAEAFAQISKFDFEATKIATTETVIGKETVIPVTCYSAVSEGTVFITRDDWYEGHPGIPTDPVVIFDLCYVSPRRES